MTIIYVVAVLAVLLLFSILALLGYFCSCEPKYETSIFEKTFETIDANTLIYENVALLCRDACVSIVADNGSLVVFGSGFVVDILPKDEPESRYIVTAAHVVVENNSNQRFSDIFAVISNANNISGQNIHVQCVVVGVDIAADVCVLRTTGTVFTDSQTVISIRSSEDTFPQGSPCVVIGNPLGTDVSSLASGIVRDGKYVDQGALESLYTTTPILPGNSGSPFVSISGEVIGLVSWVKVYDEAAQANFSGGVNHFMLSRVVQKLISIGTDFTDKGYLGITATEPLCGYYMLLNPSLPAVNGMIIITLDGNSVLRDVGVVEGDILLSVGGQDVGVFDNQYSIGRKIWFAAGETLSIKYLRSATGVEVRVDQVTVGVLPSKHDIFSPTAARLPVYLREKHTIRAAAPLKLGISTP
jgi:S1-C subfamily serine protease